MEAAAAYFQTAGNFDTVFNGSHRPVRIGNVLRTDLQNTVIGDTRLETVICTECPGHVTARLLEVFQQQPSITRDTFTGNRPRNGRSKPVGRIF